MDKTKEISKLMFNPNSSILNIINHIDAKPIAKCDGDKLLATSNHAKSKEEKLSQKFYYKKLHHHYIPSSKKRHTITKPAYFRTKDRTYPNCSTGHLFSGSLDYLSHSPRPDAQSAILSSNKKMFHCAKCQYITDRKNNLKRHVATMHENCDKVLECCDTVFANKSSLRDHVITCHKQGYICAECGRNFCRKALLKRHVTVHSGQKDYVCPVCNYATSHKSNLDRHTRRHKPKELSTVQGIVKDQWPQKHLPLRSMWNMYSNTLPRKHIDITSDFSAFNQTNSTFSNFRNPIWHKFNKVDNPFKNPFAMHAANLPSIFNPDLVQTDLYAMKLQEKYSAYLDGHINPQMSAELKEASPQTDVGSHSDYQGNILKMAVSNISSFNETFQNKSNISECKAENLQQFKELRLPKCNCNDCYGKVPGVHVAHVDKDSKNVYTSESDNDIIPTPCPDDKMIAERNYFMPDFTKSAMRRVNPLFWPPFYHLNYPLEDYKVSLGNRPFVTKVSKIDDSSCSVDSCDKLSVCEGEFLLKQSNMSRDDNHQEGIATKTDMAQGPINLSLKKKVKLFPYKYKCSFPDCTGVFRNQLDLNQHLQATCCHRYEVLSPIRPITSHVKSVMMNLL